MKRLLFPYAPDPEESLIGAFAEALHDHRIRSVRTVIEGAGFSLSRPGSLQMAADEQVAAIAAVMRCDVAALRAVAFGSTALRARIALGDLILPRTVFDLERRHIAPGELVRRPIHRADWLNLLLPYCPQSLELLVDACPTCGPLGWTVTRGVSRCDHCGEVVPPSDVSGLAKDSIGPYRFAADLMSRSGDVGTAARSRLPEAIQTFSRSSLCDVMIRAGIALGTRRSGHALAEVLAKPPAEIAAVVAAGSRLIAGWPQSAKEAVRERIDGMGGDLTGYDRLRVNLKWIGRGSDEGERLAALAFPTLDGRTANPFAGEKRYYTATEVNAKLCANSGDLKLLRAAGAVDFEELPSNRRLRARYDADDVDDLRAALDEGVSPGSAASELDVPVYALGQFVAAGLLELSEAPGTRILRGVQISKRSIRNLVKKVSVSVSDRPPSVECVSVRRLLGAYPGEKPWSACVDLLIRKMITPYAGGDGFSIRDLLLHPCDLAGLSVAGGTVEQDPTGIARISLRDAYEVLGAPAEEAMAAIRSARLEILSEGRGKSVDRRELQLLAAEIAFVGEIALQESSSPIAIFHRLSRLNIPRIHGVWSRAALTERGMLKPIVATDAGSRSRQT